ncbi:IS3 family transposase [Paenibacillus sp. NPDC058071]|uniref:IS3 family transposase n=1 Tax=Paenibacillus sp. NPDC058071 TaxID=3346326 RepID=UPI0036D934CD
MVGYYEGGGVPEKCRIVEELREYFTVTALCKEVGLSKSGFYAYLKRKAVDKDKSSKAIIRTTYERYKGIYGYRQIQLFMYQDHGVWMNHKKILRLMQEMGLQAKIRRKFRHHRSWSLGDRIVRNVLYRNFEALQPNQKWVTDVTQYRVKDSWLYLSTIKDLCQNEIVAYNMSLRNDKELVIQTFSKAFEKEKDVTGANRSQRSGIPVHVLRLPRHAAKGWCPNQHVSTRQLLRQCLNGELLLTFEDGSTLSI